jgi:hypothetical protein
VKLLDYFNAFMTNTVNLDQARLDTLDEQVQALFAIASDDDTLGVHVEDYIRTGSWAHRTIIKPVRNKDFDGDILLHLEEVEGWEPRRYLSETRAAFARSDSSRDLIKDSHDRCVRIDFSDDGHIDVVPYIIRGETEDGEGEQSIVNAATNEFEETNPTGLAEWMRANDRLAHGHLRKVIRLLKYLRDHKSTFSIPSIILTTFLGEQVQAGQEDARYADLPTALLNILTDLDRWLDGNPTMPQIEDPSCPGVTFNHRWDEDRYMNFRTQVKRYKGWVKEAYDEPDRALSLAAWQRVFGDDFKAPTSAVAAVANVTEALPWKVPVAGEENIEDRGFTWQRGNFATISGRVVAQPSTGSRGGDLRSIKHLRRGRSLEFRVKTDVRVPYRIFWKVRNTGVEAAQDNGLRGEIREGTRDTVHTESTKYRGQHKIECYIVVNDKIVAYAWQPVTIE